MAKKLIVEIAGDASSLDKALKHSTSSVQKFSVGLGTIVKSAVAFQAISKGFDLIGSAARASIDEFSQQQKVAAQTQAVLKSTGAAAGVAAKQIESLATSIQGYSGIDDEAVQSGENLLLTFRNIRNVAGKGNDIFTQTTRAVVDLSVAMGKDIPSSALAIGKALNDPVKGFARLQRIGVTFSAQQIKLIKTFQQTGQTAKAQKVILGELTKEFGGSARALGNTVPGQLNKIKETLRNIGGDVVGAVAPAFSKALDSVSGFVQKLGRAKTAKAKFRVVFDGITDLGKNLFNQVTSVLRRINWTAAVGEAEDALISALRAIAGAANRVNWGAVGKAISGGLSRAIQGVAAFLQSVDWGIVGQKIVKGISDFLKNVNWKALAVGTIKLLVAAFKAVNQLVLGIGKGIAGALGNAIKAGFDAVAPKVEAAALRIVLKILKALDFKVLGRHVIPGINSLVKSIEAKLDELAAHAEGTGTRVAAALEKAAGQVNRSAAIQPTPKKTTKPAPRTTTGATEADLTDPDAAAKAAKQAAANAKKRAAAAAKVLADAQTKKQQAFQDMIASLQIKVDRSALTKSLKDDLKPLLDLKAGLQKQIKAGVDVLSAQSQLVSVEGQIQDKQAEIRAKRKADAQAAIAGRTSKQFKALGLTATGDQITPGVKNLRKQLSQLTTTLGPDIAPKLQSQIAKMGKVLSGSFGKVTLETRKKIKELIDAITGTLDDVGKDTGTKFRKTGFKDLISGVEGLTSTQIKKLRSAFVQTGPGGTRPQRGFGALGGLAFASNFPAAGGGSPLVVQVNLDGRQVAKTVEPHVTVIQQRNRNRRGASRTGTTPGI